MSRLEAALSWLVEPRPAPTARDLGSAATAIAHGAAALPRRPVVAVVGLTRGCGVTTMAHALAAVLARRDHSGVAIVATPVKPPGSALAVPAASRLGRRFDAAARGRLCLTAADPSPELARVAPLVLDVPHGAAPSLPAHVTILVVPGDAEPALAELAAQALADPLTVVNRVSDPARWSTRAFALLPDSRSAAWLAAAGWEPCGAFGGAITKIADACEEAACA